MSTRYGSTAAFRAESIKDQVTPVFFVKLEYDSGILRFWSGYGDLSWDSQTWNGTSKFGRISEISETNEIKTAQMTLMLNGVDSALISTVFNEDYQERPASVWLGYLDSVGAIVADPYKFFGGRMDVMLFEDDGESADISLICENRLVDFERPTGSLVTHEDQQERYSGDLGLEFVSDIRDKAVRWGFGQL